MPAPLPSALRARFEEYIAEGLSGRAAAARLKLSAATGVRWKRKLHETGAIEPAPRGRPRGYGKLAPHQAFLEELVSGEAFAAYIREVLAPELEPGTVVICDNLATHKNVEAAAALREHGCWFLYLPPYSPDLNPIEMAFAKLKAHLRRLGARTFDQLFEALAEVCDLFTPDECWNYFREAGYASK